MHPDRTWGRLARVLRGFTVDIADIVKLLNGIRVDHNDGALTSFKVSDLTWYIAVYELPGNPLIIVSFVIEHPGQFISLTFVFRFLSADESGR